MIKLQMIGHLGKSALKGQVNGKSVLNFSVAHSEKYKNFNGEDMQRTTWAECSLWERENLAPYLLQGTLVYIEGTPHLEPYVNKKGEAGASLKLRITNLQLLSKREEPPLSAAHGAAPEVNAAIVAEAAEELPF